MQLIANKLPGADVQPDALADAGAVDANPTPVAAAATSASDAKTRRNTSTSPSGVGRSGRLAAAPRCMERGKQHAVRNRVRSAARRTLTSRPMYDKLCQIVSCAEFGVGVE